MFQKQSEEIKKKESFQINIFQKGQEKSDDDQIWIPEDLPTTNEINKNNLKRCKIFDHPHLKDICF